MRAGRFADLAPRVVSGGVMAAIGAAAVLGGGPWFLALVVAVVAAMLWELARMQGAAPVAAVGIGMASGAALVVAALLPPWGALALALPPLAAAAAASRDRWIALGYGGGVMLAAFGMSGFLAQHGTIWLLWLLLVVVATDTAGYFFGRLIGGPRFWPRISPRKTWAGILAGWVAAALVGAAFAGVTGAAPGLPLLSAFVAVAAQAGDIAESSVKRRAGVKDSSRLIPGHGGVLDRFDGILGAALFALALAQVVPLPEVRL